MNRPCEFTLSIIDARDSRLDTDKVARIGRIITQVPECTVDLHAGEVLNVTLTGNCTAVFGPEGQLVRGRCIKRRLRSVGTYAGEYDSGCPAR